MNRRDLLKTGITGVATFLPLTILAAKAGAQTVTAGEQTWIITTDISRNHGHSLELSLDLVVTAMQRARQDGTVKMNIQGDSGHPHSIELNLNQLVDLISLGTLTVETSLDAGHTHLVKLSLARGA